MTTRHPLMDAALVSKNDESCIKNDEFCIKNDELCRSKWSDRIVSVLVWAMISCCAFVQLQNNRSKRYEIPHFSYKIHHLRPI